MCRCGGIDTEYICIRRACVDVQVWRFILSIVSNICVYVCIYIHMCVCVHIYTYAGMAEGGDVESHKSYKLTREVKSQVLREHTHTHTLSLSLSLSLTH